MMHYIVIGEWEKGRQRKKEPQAMHKLCLASVTIGDIWIGAN